MNAVVGTNQWYTAPCRCVALPGGCHRDEILLLRLVLKAPDKDESRCDHKSLIDKLY
jgi:hypothetical protein